MNQEAKNRRLGQSSWMGMGFSTPIRWQVPSIGQSCQQMKQSENGLHCALGSNASW